MIKLKHVFIGSTILIANCQQHTVKQNVISQEIQALCQDPDKDKINQENIDSLQQTSKQNPIIRTQKSLQTEKTLKKAVIQRNWEDTGMLFQHFPYLSLLIVQGEADDHYGINIMPHILNIYKSVKNQVEDEAEKNQFKNLCEAWIKALFEINEKVKINKDLDTKVYWSLAKLLPRLISYQDVWLIKLFLGKFPDKTPKNTLIPALNSEPRLRGSIEHMCALFKDGQIAICSESLDTLTCLLDQYLFYYDPIQLYTSSKMRFESEHASNRKNGFRSVAPQTWYQNLDTPRISKKDQLIHRFVAGGFLSTSIPDGGPSFSDDTKKLIKKQEQQLEKENGQQKTIVSSWIRQSDTAYVGDLVKIMLKYSSSRFVANAR